MDDHRPGEMRHIWYVPADDRARLETAAGSAAHGLNLDLEDGVLPARKAAARTNIVALLEGRPELARRAVVRINDIGSAEWEQDVESIFGVTHTILVPMLRALDDLRRLEDVLVRLEEAHGVAVGSKRLYLVVETAWLVANLRETLAASQRIRGLIVGQADLTVDLGCEGISEDGGFVPSASVEWSHGAIVCAAAERRIPAFISPWAPNHDRAYRVREARRLFALGYQGMVIGSAEAVEDVDAAWRPSPAQAEFARLVLRGAAETKERGYGVAVCDGWATEAPHVEIARRVLRRVGGEAS